MKNRNVLSKKPIGLGKSLEEKFNSVLNIRKFENCGYFYLTKRLNMRIYFNSINEFCLVKAIGRSYLETEKE